MPMEELYINALPLNTNIVKVHWIEVNKYEKSCLRGKENIIGKILKH